MPPRETILAALHARPLALPATALRGGALPERVSAASLLILRDGEPEAPQQASGDWPGSAFSDLKTLSAAELSLQLPFPLVETLKQRPLSVGRMVRPLAASFALTRPERNR